MRKGILLFIFLCFVLVSGSAQQFNTATFQQAVRPIQTSLLFSRKLISASQLPLFTKLENEMGMKLVDQYYPLISGSAFFITDQGHMITNEHVIDINYTGVSLTNIMRYFLQRTEKDYGYVFNRIQFSEFSEAVNKIFIEGDIKQFVLMPDGKYLELNVLASDEKLDLALLQIPVTKKTEYLRFLKAKNIPDVKEVYSIGYPLPGIFKMYFAGTKPTVTSGIVSALREKIIETGSEKKIKTIQHTASISPGNSGGPLVTATGIAAGVNSSLLTEGNNIYFAISAEEVSAWMNDLQMQDLLQFRSYASALAGDGSAQLVRVDVHTIPPEAKVFIDDDFMGNTPVSVDLPKSSSYSIQIRKDGYIEINNSIEAGVQDLKIDYRLVPGGILTFDSGLPPNTRITARKGSEKLEFDPGEPVNLPNGQWSIGLTGPISNGKSVDVNMKSGDISLSPGLLLKDLELVFPNLLPESKILLRPSLEPVKKAGNRLSLPYGKTELLIQTPFYKDNLLTISPDNENQSFSIDVDYQRSNQYLKKRRMSISLPFLIAGIATAGASAVLNIDTVAAAMSGTYSIYSALKYITFGTLVAGSISTVVGTVGVIGAVSRGRKLDEPVSTEYDFNSGEPEE